MDKNLLLRILSGLVYIAIVIIGTTLHPLGFVALMATFLAFCVFEMTTILKFDSKLYLLFTIIFIGYFFYTHTIDFLNDYVDFNLRISADYSKILKVSLFIIAVYTLFFYAEELYNDQAKLIFYTCYLGIPFYLSLCLPNLTHIKVESINSQTLIHPIVAMINGPMTLEVLFLFILIWVSDTFAYLFGRLFGKHKLAPTISEKKTWEGLIGGIVFTIITGVFIQYYGVMVKGNWVHISIIVAIFAPFGDLVESKLKRIFGIKDSSGLIPGHGGFLDRLDSFLVCVPAIYIYYLILSI